MVVVEDIIVDFIIRIVVGIVVGGISARCFFGNKGTEGTKGELGLFCGIRVFLWEQCREQEGTVGNNGNKVLHEALVFSTDEAHNTRAKGF